MIRKDYSICVGTNFKLSTAVEAPNIDLAKVGYIFMMNIIPLYLQSEGVAIGAWLIRKINVPKSNIEKFHGSH